MIDQLCRGLRSLGRYGRLLFEAGRDIAFHGLDIREFTRQIEKIGRESLPIVLLTGLFTGMVLALQTAYGLGRFGGKDYVGNVVGLGMVRELGPVLTAVMVCGRVGAGIAAEIGSMVVTEQVDAIRALGANPIRKLVSPRLAAAVIALPALAVFADAVGVFGGQFVAVFELDQGIFRYQQALLYTILIRDVTDGLIKSAVFGLLFVSIACYKGLNTKGGTEGVGAATTSSVVTGAIVVFISDFFLTKLLMLF